MIVDYAAKIHIIPLIPIQKDRNSSDMVNFLVIFRPIPALWW